MHAHFVMSRIANGWVHLHTYVHGDDGPAILLIFLVFVFLREACKQNEFMIFRFCKIDTTASLVD